MSHPYTFAIDKVSFTSPPSVPIGTPFKRLAWAHQSGQFTLVIRPSDYHLSLEFKGLAEPFNRTIPNTASRKIVNRPTITHDDRKIMFKYDWPIHTPASLGHLQERFQIVLKAPEQMPAILRILSTNFDTTRSGSQSRQTPQDTSASQQGRRPESQGSQLKRQKTDDFSETRMLPSRISAQSGLADTLGTDRLPSPILETQGPTTGSSHKPSVSPSNLSSQGHFQDMQPTHTKSPTTRLQEVSHSGKRTPEEETSDGSTATPMTSSGSNGVQDYIPLDPTPLTPQAGEKRLINLDSPLEPRINHVSVDVRSMPLSPSNLIGLETFTTEQEEDEADQELGGRFPPLQPPTRKTTTDILASPFPLGVTGTSRPNHHIGLPRGPDALMGGASGRETHALGTIGKGIYDMSEAEVESQIESVLHERGFLDLVEKVGAILTKRQFVQDQEFTTPPRPQPRHQAPYRQVQQTASLREDHMRIANFSNQVWHQGQNAQDLHVFAGYQGVWGEGGEDVSEVKQQQMHGTTKIPDDPFDAEMDSV
ncbi:hypothetical protein DB88DRAFT_537581 [Papiliotrema laurentii]|uniref:Uncharacterized protein n=1 Tax=Papiliotrema laurentii TaxID=5418 RepID=A0AAD9FX32_PAPLA|nr:hypothetical protein DB88DRAFT_537581 [Papiliotrema laurentii]